MNFFQKLIIIDGLYFILPIYSQFIQNYQNRMYKDIKYTYQEKNQDFFQQSYPNQKTKVVGQIITKYPRAQMLISHRYPKALEMNYSQLYHDITHPQQYTIYQKTSKSVQQLPKKSMGTFVKSSQYQPIQGLIGQVQQEQQININDQLRSTILRKKVKNSNIWYKISNEEQPQENIIINYEENMNMEIDNEDQSIQEEFQQKQNQQLKKQQQQTQRLMEEQRLRQKQRQRQEQEQKIKQFQNQQQRQREKQLLLMQEERQKIKNYQKNSKATLLRLTQQLQRNSIRSKNSNYNNHENDKTNQKLDINLNTKRQTKQHFTVKHQSFNSQFQLKDNKTQKQFSRESINFLQKGQQIQQKIIQLHQNQKTNSRFLSHRNSFQKLLQNSKIHSQTQNNQPFTVKLLSNQEQNQKIKTKSINQSKINNTQEQLIKNNPQKPQNEIRNNGVLIVENQDQRIQKFNLQDYANISVILRQIQTSLKCKVIDNSSIVKFIRKYLELVARGNLDNIDDFDLQLHKKKIVKNALLLQRVGIIIVGFCYANQSLKECHKYILNIISYSLNSCLMLIQVLYDSQISQQKKQVTMKSNRLKMKQNLDTIRNNNDILNDSITKLTKYQNLFYQNLKQIMKMLHKTSIEQTFYNILQYLSFFLCLSSLHHMLPFLAVSPDPYLPPTLTNRYTLLIDLVQVCCFSKSSKHPTFRPYTQHFLSQMNNYYEIIVFTSFLPNEIDKIITAIDRNGYIKHRLYRHHCIYSGAKWIKQIGRVGRDLSKTILLDNENSVGLKSKQNLIHIPPWRGNKSDSILAEICPTLAMITIKNISTEVAVRKIKEQNLKNQQQKLKYVNFGINFQ